ncbi:MAG: hypothetical protein Q4G67_03180 [Actinomycetia bacterium]|nr:hypothetical protein [Actinomycetes bacterium]
MTTWIGTIGHMAPGPCAATLDVSAEDRVVHGGGPGTLAPARVRVYGPPSRAWAVTAGRRPAELAVIESLARRQARYGGALRVLPCDAIEHNMLSPQASEDLEGWSGLARVTRPDVAGVGSGADSGEGSPALYPSTSLYPSSTLYPSAGTPPRVDLGGVWPALVGEVAAGTTAPSPRVPVPRAGTLYAAVHVTGNPIVRVIVRDHVGAALVTETLQVTGGTAALTRTVHLPVTAPEAAVSVELAVQAPTMGSGVWVAWPSIAYAATDYVPGRGCDAAWLSSPQRSVAWTWGAGFEDHSWTIREVGQ